MTNEEIPSLPPGPCLPRGSLPRKLAQRSGRKAGGWNPILRQKSRHLRVDVTRGAQHAHHVRFGVTARRAPTRNVAIAMVKRKRVYEPTIGKRRSAFMI